MENEDSGGVRRLLDNLNSQNVNTCMYDGIKTLNERLFGLNVYTMLNKPIVKGLCKFQVHIPINAKVTAIQSSKNLHTFRGALLYKPVRDVPFFRVSFFSINF